MIEVRPVTAADFDLVFPLLNELNPDLVLYDAGVDIWQEDGLGKLDISWQGIEKRDHLVLKRCLANNTPVQPTRRKTENKN